jgi:diacylglycerol kinase family enzyme
VIVLLNRAAGMPTGERRDEEAAVRAAFARHGLPADLRVVAPADFRARVAAAAAERPDALVVGGGDGTVAAGAEAAVRAGVTLGVLPLGTLNHFARDLGLPADVDGAVAVIAAGVAREVDVGDGGGRIFVNNASMGLYTEAVEDRERIRARSGTGKWRAMARAALTTLRRFPLMRVELRMLDGAVRLTTPLVFVGNNRYDMRLFALGRRQALDEGRLWLYVARDGGRVGFLGLAGRALLGRLDQARDFLALAVGEVEIGDRRRTMRVAFDGEPCEVASPLRLAIRPRALRVFAPPPPAE